MSNSMVTSPKPALDAHPPIGARVMLTEDVTIDSNDHGQRQSFDAGQRGTVEDLYDQMLWVKLDGNHPDISETGGCLVFHLGAALPVQVLSEDVELDHLTTTARAVTSVRVLIDEKTPIEGPHLRFLQPEDIDLSFLGADPLPELPHLPGPQPAETRLLYSPELMASNAILLQRDALQALRGSDTAARRYNVRLRNLARALAPLAVEEDECPLTLAEPLPALRAIALAVMLMMFCGALGMVGSLQGQACGNCDAPIAGAGVQ